MDHSRPCVTSQQAAPMGGGRHGESQICSIAVSLSSVDMLGMSQTLLNSEVASCVSFHSIVGFLGGIKQGSAALR